MNKNLAIRLMIAQAFLFSTETATIHEIGTRLPITELALLRTAAGIIVGVICAKTLRINSSRNWFAVFRTRRPALQIVRGLVGYAYLWILMFSFGHLPLADATAISYTQVAYITFFSAIILGETVGPQRWLATGIGIAGALLIAQPTLQSINYGYIIVILGTSLNGLSFVLNRLSQRDDNEDTTMLYSNIIPCVGFIVFLPTMSVPDTNILLLLTGVTVLGPIGMYAGIIALKNSEASILGPYTLLRLVIGVTAGILIFHETPNLLGIIGTLLILIGCILALQTKRRTTQHVRMLKQNQMLT